LGFIPGLGRQGWCGAVPESYQQSMEKAEAVEQTMQDAAQQRLQDLDQRGQ
jgi:hypothetical protein